MRFGCCVTYDQIDVLSRHGYDYAELPVCLTLHPDIGAWEFAEIRKRVAARPLRVECFNYFSSGDLKVVGPDVDRKMVRHYVDVCLRRAVELGGQVVGFGSGASRSYPSGFPAEVARMQLLEFLGLMGEQARKYGLVVTLEPLNRQETNLVNTTSEALSLLRELNRAEVGLTLDFHHMLHEHEGLEVIASAVPYLRHVHIATFDRQCPHGELETFANLFAELKGAGYDGRVSIEAICDELEQECQRSLAFLKKAEKTAGLSSRRA